MPNETIPKVALRWTPIGRRKRDRLNHLAEYKDEGTERGGPFMGQTTGQSTGKGSEVGYDCGLMSNHGTGFSGRV